MKPYTLGAFAGFFMALYFAGVWLWFADAPERKLRSYRMVSPIQSRGLNNDRVALTIYSYRQPSCRNIVDEQEQPLKRCADLFTVSLHAGGMR